MSTPFAGAVYPLPQWMAVSRKARQVIITSVSRKQRVIPIRS